MCYAPITIKNNSSTYRPLVSKDFVKVPCGKCRECQLHAENDWFVRIYYEWLRTTQQGGQVFFITCTYNNAHLPVLDTSRYSSLNHVLMSFFCNTEKYRLNDEDWRALRNRVDRYQERYETLSIDIPFFNHACFSDTHITSFIKALRQYLNKENILKYEDAPLKYFSVCEYGDDKKRPHYHMLLFVPKPVNSDTFLKLCKRSWSYRVPIADCPKYVLDELQYCRENGITYKNFGTPNTKQWYDWYILYESTSKRYTVRRQRGFVNYSEKDNKVRPIIEDIQGCKYLTRYLNYYDNYLRTEGFDQLRDWIKLFPNIASVSGYERVNDLLHELKLVFPFKRVSKDFGGLFLSQLENLPEDALQAKLKENEVIIPNEKKPYPIPSYIVNRLCYQRETLPELVNPVSFFTPLGYKVFVDTFEDKLKLKEQMYTETLHVLRGFLKADDVKQFRLLYGWDIASIINFPFGFSFRNLALFDVVLNGVSVSHMTDIMHLEKMSANDIIDNCWDLYINQLALRTSFLEPPQVLFDDLYFLKIANMQYLKERSYNALPQFEFYDKILTVIDYIRKIVLERDAQEQKQKYTEFTQVREALNKYRFTN